MAIPSRYTGSSSSFGNTAPNIPGYNAPYPTPQQVRQYYQSPKRRVANFAPDTGNYGIPARFGLREYHYRPRYWVEKGLNYWENPQRIARYKQVEAARPPGAAMPDWYDGRTVDEAYGALQEFNQGQPWWQWEPLPSGHPTRLKLAAMQAPPPPMLMPGEEKYYTPIKQEDIGSPAQGGMTDDAWENSTWWQRGMMNLFSSPALPMTMTALPAAAIGTAIAGPAGTLGGLAIGSGLGYLASKYPENPIVQKVGALFDIAYQGILRTLGTGAQVYGAATDPEKYGSLNEVLGGIKNISSTWKSGQLASYGLPFDPFEGLQKAERSFKQLAAMSIYNLPGQEQSTQRLLKQIEGMKQTAPQGHMWTVNENTGQWEVVPLPEEDYLQLLTEARRRIMAGEAPNEVTNDYITQYGMSGAFKDLTLGLVIDPFNYMDSLGVVSKLGGKFGDVIKNPDLATAYRQTRTLTEGAQQYANILRTTKPAEEISNMGAVSRWLTGVTKEGVDTRLFNQPFKVTDPRTWYFFRMTPASRATEVTNLSAVNTALLLDRAGLDEAEMVRYVHSLAKTPPDLARELSMRWIEAPDGAALPLALNDSLQKVDTLYAAYTASEWQRGTLHNLAKISGQTPEAVISKIAAGDSDVLFRQFENAARSSSDPAAADIVQAIDAGQLTKETLPEMVKSFTGKDPIPYNAETFRDQLYTVVTDSVSDWAAEWFNVKPDPTWVRTSNTVKAAQSLVLLGLNPAYLMNNVINNVVTMASTGVLGLRNSNEIAGLWERFGIVPPRLQSGIGAHGVGVELQGKAIQDAMRSPGLNESLQNFFREKANKLGVFSTLSGKAEQWSSAQAYTAGMVQFMARNWQKGKGFDPLPPHLDRALRQINPNLPDVIHAAVAGGMNQKEIEAALYAGISRMSIDAALPKVAERMKAAGSNLTDADIAETLKHTGVYDQLTEALKEAETDEQVHAAFEKVEDKVNDWLDDQSAQELGRMAEETAARVGRDGEGLQAALEIWDTANVEFSERWYEGYIHWQDAFERSSGASPAQRNAIMRRTDMNERRAWERQYKRMKAQYLGIMNGLGVENTTSRRYIDLFDQQVKAQKEFFDLRSKRNGDFFDTRENLDYTQANTEWQELQAELMRAYQDMNRRSNDLQTEMDGIFAGLVENQFGPGGKQAAEQWRKGVLDVRTKMQADMEAHRQRIANMGRVERQAAWADFLHNPGGYMNGISQLFNANVTGARQLYEALLGKTPEGIPPLTPPAPARPIDPSTLATVKGRRVETPGGQGETLTPVLEDGSIQVRLDSGEVTKYPIEQVRPTESPLEGGETAPAALTPPAAQQPPDIQARNIHREIANEYGIATADENGVPLNNDKHLINIARKYLDDDFRTLEDITPERLREALENRALEKQAEADAVEAQRTTLEEAQAADEAGPVMDEATLQREAQARAVREKYGYTLEDGPEQISPAVQLAAQTMLEELEAGRAELIPAPEPKHAGHMIRSTSNPDWYRELYKTHKVSKKTALNALRNLAQGKEARSAIYTELYRIAEGKARSGEGSFPDIGSLLKGGFEEKAVDLFGQVWNNPNIPKADDVLQMIFGTRDAEHSAQVFDLLFDKWGEESLAYNSLREAHLVKLNDYARRWPLLDEDHIRQMHKDAVTEAIADGLDVPHNVLLDHPELLDVYENFRAVREEIAANERIRVSEAESRALLRDESGGEELFQGKKQPGQIDMFGAGEDLPLFTGAAVRGQESVFDPNAPAPPRQGTLFDMRPQDMVEGRAIQGGEATGPLFDRVAMPEPDPIPETGQYPAVRTDDGTIYVDLQPDKSTHVLFIQRKGIPPERVVDGGWVKDGVYDATPYSDTVRYANQQRAKAKVDAANAAALERRRTRQQVVDLGQSEQYADDYMRILDAEARVMAAETGQPLDELYRRLGIEGGEGTEGELPQGNRGSITFEEGRAIIRAFQSSDASTMIHETGHFFRRDLRTMGEYNAQALQDYETAAGWAGAEFDEALGDYSWTTKAEEKFARGFEQYLMDGKAPTPEMANVFERFAKWLAEIYARFRNQLEPLTPEMRQVYDRLLTGYPEKMRYNIDTETGRARVMYPGTEFQPAPAVETPQFRRWFGDSILVDENGIPQTMYHATRADFQEFRTINWAGELGPHIGALEQAEGRLAWMRGGYDKPDLLPNETIMPVYVKLESPLRIDKDLGVFSGRQIGKYLLGQSTTTDLAIKINNEIAEVDRRFADRIRAADEASDNEVYSDLYYQRERVISAVVRDLLEEAGYDGLQYKNQVEGEGFSYVPFRGEQVKSVFNKEYTPYDPNILHQPEIPVEFEDGRRTTLNRGGEPPAAVNHPLGTVEGASGADSMPHATVQDEGFRTRVKPIMEQMRTYLTSNEAKVQVGKGDLDKLDPISQREMRKYLSQVYGQLSDTKLQAARFAEGRRDAALLNYSKRYGMDNVLGAVMPYQFWYTRSALQWALRALDKPAIFSNYFRLRKAQDEMREVNGYPTRLKGKIKIPVPFLPEHMGGGIYIDPWRQLFPFTNMSRPFEMAAEEKNQVQRRAEGIVSQMLEDGEITQEQAAEALTTREGATWQQAYTQAELDTETEINNPLDFAFLMSGPSLPIQWAYNAVMGQPEKIGQLPPTRLVQNVTGALGANQGKGINIEGPLRRALGLPEIDRYQDYRVDRELASMAAEGVISPDDAQLAMVDRSGPAFLMAEQRVARQGQIKYLGAPLGVDLFPEGEQEQRGLKEEYDRARQYALAGDETALREFYEAYPEYEARNLSFREDPEKRLRTFMISQLWDKWMSEDIPDLHKQQLSDKFGPLFSEGFINKETRSYDSIDTATLAAWGRAMNAALPQTAPATPQFDYGLAPMEEANAYQQYSNEKRALFPTIAKAFETLDQAPEQYKEYLQEQLGVNAYYDWRNQYLAANPQVIQHAIGPDSKVAGAPPEIQALYYQYIAARDQMFPDVFDLQDQYFDLPKSARKVFLERFPELKQYWDWQAETLQEVPDLIPYVKSNETIKNALYPPEDEAKYASSSSTKPKSGDGDYMLTQVELAQFSPALIRALFGYYYAGEQLGGGARKELARIMKKAERSGNIQEYLDGIVKHSFVRPTSN